MSRCHNSHSHADPLSAWHIKLFRKIIESETEKESRKHEEVEKLVKLRIDNSVCVFTLNFVGFGTRHHCLPL